MRVPQFDDYAQAFDHVEMRREGGVLELALHTGGGPLVWGDGPHTELGYCFATVGADPDNRVVILTGTGSEFIARLDHSWVGAMTPEKWDKIYSHGKRLLHALLDIPVPVIAAVNGKATVHGELAVLSDIVLASDTAVFSDAPHFRFGTVAGDGVHIVWPELLGMNRGRYFLLTGQRLSAHEMLTLGVVNEVLAPDALMHRARELANDLASKPISALRYTREAITRKWKRLLMDDLGHGLALEGLGAYESWPT